MSQLSLFDPPPAPPKPKSPDFRAIRTDLLGALRRAAHANKMPWSAEAARKWEEDFPRLAELLPDGEGQELLGYFREQMERLKKIG
jgi:hypothetical protein